MHTGEVHSGQKGKISDKYVDYWDNCPLFYAIKPLHLQIYLLAYQPTVYCAQFKEKAASDEDLSFLALVINITKCKEQREL
jgi:hypothetical protein